MFKNFKLYYNNIRGIKSKMASLQDIINEYDPHVICINETHLGQDEGINIKGYKVFYNNKKEGRGGIVIGIKNKFKHLSIEIETKTEEFETLWVTVSNEIIKIRVGCIYAPQESRNDIKVFKRMYEHIGKQILDANKKGEKILITGVFNCKIGEEIEGNKTEISKSGKIFKQMILENNLNIVNSSKEKCEGLWTRIEGENKSIIDYVLIDEKEANKVIKMKIDENKDYTPYHVSQSRIIYSDHCAIRIKMNWRTIDNEIDNTKTIVTEQTLQKFHNITNSNILTNIVKKEVGILNKYKKWQEKIDELIGKSFSKKKCKNKTTTIIHKLTTRKRVMKKYVKINQNSSETERIKMQIGLINKYILNEQAKLKAKEIEKEIPKLKKRRRYKFCIILGI